MSRFMFISNNSLSFIEILSLLIKKGYYDNFEDIFKGVLPRVIEKYYLKSLRLFISGKKLSESLRGNKYFNAKLVNEIKIYEDTGNLEDNISKLVKREREKLLSKIQILTTLFEPVLIIIIGGAVMTIALSVILPIYKLSGNLRMK
jgi:general secretion pathway protein F